MTFAHRYQPLLYVKWIEHGSGGHKSTRRGWTLFWETQRDELRKLNALISPWRLVTPDLFNTYAEQFGEERALDKVLSHRWLDVAGYVPRLRYDADVRLAFEAILLTQDVIAAYNYVLQQEGLVVRTENGCAVVVREAGGPVHRGLEGR